MILSWEATLNNAITKSAMFLLMHIIKIKSILNEIIFIKNDHNC